MDDPVRTEAGAPRGLWRYGAIALALLAVGSVLYRQGGDAGKAAVPAAVSALAGLNTGEMAAFLPADAPKAMPPVTFVAADGSARTLDAFKGKVILLNLWATWCAPCRKEMPALEALKTEFGGRDFDVVALSADRGGIEKPKKFWAETGLKSLDLYLDTSDALRSLALVGLPGTILLDRQGREIGRLLGPAEWNSADAKALIAAAIKG